MTNDVFPASAERNRDWVALAKRWNVTVPQARCLDAVNCGRDPEIGSATGKVLHALKRKGLIRYDQKSGDTGGRYWLLTLAGFDRCHKIDTE